MTDHADTLSLYIATGSVEYGRETGAPTEKDARAALDALVRERQQLRDARDELLERLLADPGRFAIAAVEGLRKIIPELLNEDVTQAGLILDWIGVAGDNLSLAERVRILALELATRQGYSLEEAERLAPPAFADVLAGEGDATPPEGDAAGAGGGSPTKEPT